MTSSDITTASGMIQSGNKHGPDEILNDERATKRLKSESLSVDSDHAKEPETLTMDQFTAIKNCNGCYKVNDSEGLTWKFIFKDNVQQRSEKYRSGLLQEIMDGTSENGVHTVYEYENDYTRNVKDGMYHGEGKSVNRGTLPSITHQHFFMNKKCDLWLIYRNNEIDEIQYYIDDVKEGYHIQRNNFSDRKNIVWYYNNCAADEDIYFTLLSGRILVCNLVLMMLPPELRNIIHQYSIPNQPEVINRIFPIISSMKF